MGNSCSGGAGSKEEKAKNQQIDRQLVNDNRKERQIIKLLLLGAGESGKSTIAKQMRLIHMAGFTDEERQAYIAIVHKNTIFCIRALIQAATAFGMQLPPDHEARVQRIMQGESDVLTPSGGADIRILWKEPVIQAAFTRQSEFQLPDCAQYYLEAVDRISQPNYVPTNQDLLRSRAKTTGIIVTEFEVEDIKFRMLDVGGQRSERRKWIHCFDDVTAVIFCVAISEYDLKLHEDNNVNRMHESLRVFQEVCNTQWLQKVNIILFLNKRDLFAEKIKRVDITTAFPEYKGGRNYDKAKDYIKDQFISKVPEGRRAVYTHFTCATDTDNVAVVFNAVKDIIVNDAIEGL